MVDADIEIGVVADRAGRTKHHRIGRMQGMLPIRLLNTAAAQPVGQGMAQVAPCRDGQCHQALHVGMVHQASGPQVQHLVTDGHTDTPPRITLHPEAAERQVLGREVRARIVGGFHPAVDRGVVGAIQKIVVAVGHRLNSRSCRKAPWRGARRVRDHSSSMSHLTASSRRIIDSSSGSGQASSSRWPFGSKK